MTAVDSPRTVPAIPQIPYCAPGPACIGDPCAHIGSESQPEVGSCQDSDSARRSRARDCLASLNGVNLSEADIRAARTQSRVVPHGQATPDEVGVADVSVLS